nr:MAG TPA: ChiA1-BD-binding domain protein [Caudoviricetes sp.]
MTRKDAIAYRSKIEAAASTMTDETALTAVELFPAWAVGKAYAIGDRVRYNGALYKCVQAHTSQADWTPPSAPSLFAEVLPGQGGTAIGEWQQPDSTNPYKKGDKVTHNGKTWESTADNNVWEPGVYGWTEV